MAVSGIFLGKERRVECKAQPDHSLYITEYEIKLTPFLQNLGIFYLGGIHHYLVYDAFQRDSSEKKNLLSVFVCRILFQLYHTIRQRRTAHADLLYEKREDFHSGVNGDPDDRDDYL